jgi:cytochrome c peroxidase
MNRMRLLIITGFLLWLAMIVSFTDALPPQTGVENCVAYVKTQSTEFAVATVRLQKAIESINTNPATIVQARNALKECRLRYKNIQFFLEYFFKSAALIYNGPAKYEVEEPFMEFNEPVGLQVIESLLFENKPAAKKQLLLQQVSVVNSSAKDLNALLYNFSANDQQLLESIRIELIRVITLTITGFDAPNLKSGIAESAASFTAIQHVLQPYLKNTNRGDSVSHFLTGGIHFLQLHPDFDSFNRMQFITAYALPLQRQLHLLIAELGLNLNTTGVLNYNAGDIFDPAAIDLNAFPGIKNENNTSLTKPGQQLFFEPGLSGNNKISCATCHNPEKHFTDGLPKSIAFDGRSQVQRNAPTLLYAGYQYAQLWDARSTSLEDQVKDVLNNVHEMNSNDSIVSSLLVRKPEYKALFSKAFAHGPDSLSIPDKVARCIAAFVRNLNPRNTRFDKYIQGDTAALTSNEIKGFNLFMGKAQCATCHFAPLFNGLTPPLYNRSELEVLGTLATDNFKKPIVDADPGRYKIFPISYYKRAFKTPTVRNASATAPYMHNGNFKTLASVVDFYNKGGAKGLGIGSEEQTLSPIPLQLTTNETNCIIQFIHSLQDSVNIDPFNNYHKQSFK